jgi:hypothetical protein
VRQSLYHSQVNPRVSKNILARINTPIVRLSQMAHLLKCELLTQSVHVQAVVPSFGTPVAAAPSATISRNPQTEPSRSFRDHLSPLPQRFPRTRIQDTRSPFFVEASTVCCVVGCCHVVCYVVRDFFRNASIFEADRRSSAHGKFV